MQNLSIRVSNTAQVTIQGQSAKELVKAAAFWASIPPDCPICGAEIFFTYRTPRDYEYFGLKCRGTPAHETNFGEHKEEAKGLYYKANGWGEAYARGEDDGGSGGYRDDWSPEPPRRESGYGDEPSRERDSGVDLATTKQLTLIAERAREQNILPEDMSQRMFGKPLVDLSKSQASKMIDELLRPASSQGVGMQAFAPPRQETPAQAPPPPPTNPSMPLAPSTDDDLPF